MLKMVAFVAIFAISMFVFSARSRCREMYSLLRGLYCLPGCLVNCLQPVARLLTCPVTKWVLSTGQGADLPSVAPPVKIGLMTTWLLVSCPESSFLICSWRLYFWGQILSLQQGHSLRTTLLSARVLSVLILLGLGSCLGTPSEEEQRGS